MMTMTMMMMMKTYLSCILPGVWGGGCVVSCQMVKARVGPSLRVAGQVSRVAAALGLAVVVGIEEGRGQVAGGHRGHWNEGCEL